MVQLIVSALVAPAELIVARDVDESEMIELRERFKLALNAFSASIVMRS